MKKLDIIKRFERNNYRVQVCFSGAIIITPQYGFSLQYDSLHEAYNALLKNRQ